MKITSHIYIKEYIKITINDSRYDDTLSEPIEFDIDFEVTTSSSGIAVDTTVNDSGCIQNFKCKYTGEKFTDDESIFTNHEIILDDTWKISIIKNYGSPETGIFVDDVEIKVDTKEIIITLTI